MPIKATLDDGTDIEITDDAKLVFVDHDIDFDILAHDMGDEPTEAIKVLKIWNEYPFKLILMLLDDTDLGDIDTLLEIRQQWMDDAYLFISDYGCISSHTEAESPDKWLKNYFDYVYANSKLMSHPSESHLYKAWYLGNNLNSWSSLALRQMEDIHQHIIFAISNCERASKEAKALFAEDMLINAIAIAQEY